MYEQWNQQVLKLSETRVWRTYQGGAIIDQWRGRENGTTGNFPEDWVASTTRASNPGREDIPEGDSHVLNIPNQPILADVLADQPENYFGKAHVDAMGATAGMLIKLIDAYERLTIQAHPDKKFAREIFHSEYGKTESWYILGTQEVNGEVPCVYFGFKPGVTRARWKEVFEQQDIPAMLDCLHKIPVKAGDAFFIPGGLPHAIGAGCFLAEVQEPTDYTMRTELVTPAGLRIHENQCHQGCGYEIMFDCFHYDGLSLEDTCKNWKIAPRTLVQTEGGTVNSLLDDRYTDLFQMRQMEVSAKLTLPAANQMRVWIVLEGEGTLQTSTGEVSLQQSDYLLLPASLGDATVCCTGKALKLIECLPKTFA